MESPTNQQAPNRIQISVTGHDLLHRLPQELQELQDTQAMQFDSFYHENLLLPIRKRNAIDFCSFANQTQQLLSRKTSTLIKRKETETSHDQSKRKLKLHHQNWVSEQTLINHKLSDKQARLQQQKFSEYNWESVSSSLKANTQSLLQPIDHTSHTRNIRTRARLKRLLTRKYPNRRAS